MTVSRGYTRIDFTRVRMRREKGTALIVSLLIIVLLTLLAVTGLRMSILEEQISGNQKQAAMALFAAEQGVSEALEDLFDGTISDSGLESSIAWSPSGSASGVGYSVGYTVSHLEVGGNVISNVNDDGRRYFLIESTGQTTESTGDNTPPARRLLEVAIAAEWGGESNIAGLIGCRGVTAMSNVVTSSYSSSGQDSTGDRGDIATTDADAFMYMDGSSDFDVNGEVRATGALYLGGDALVRRNALANLRITTRSNAYINHEAWTNGDFDGSNNSVGIEPPNEYMASPNPVVEVGLCDPLDIDSIFVDAEVIKTANDNGEIGIGSGSNYSGSPSTLGVDGGEKDYYFDNFTLEGEETVLIRGDVRLFVKSNFTMKSKPELILAAGASLIIYVETGNFWMDSEAKANHDPDNNFPLCNPGGCPINLKVFSLTENDVKDYKNWTDDEPNVWDDSQDVAGVKIDSNSVFYGMMYAPRAHVVLYSNTVFYGSARGRYVTADSNLDFHYDEDLDALWTGLPTDYKVVYWTELYPE